MALRIFFLPHLSASTPDGISVTNVVRDIIGRTGNIDLAALSAVVEVDVDHEWGKEIQIVNNELYCNKFLVYENLAPSSLHYHRNKHKTFKVVKGRVLITREYGIGEEVVVPSGHWHQMRALEIPSVLDEVSTHHDDSDTYRFESKK